MTGPARLCVAVRGTRFRHFQPSPARCKPFRSVWPAVCAIAVLDACRPGQHSGMGRELDLNALDEYTEIKSVWINDGQP
jgi:hypothetical protein